MKLKPADCHQRLTSGFHKHCRIGLGYLKEIFEYIKNSENRERTGYVIAGLRVSLFFVFFASTFPKFKTLEKFVGKV